MEANRRDHWTTRRKRFTAQRDSVREAWMFAPLIATGFSGLCLPCTVTLTRIGRKCDSDNLAGAFKAVRDEVASLIGVDDGDDRLTWIYAQRPGPDGIEISVASLREPQPQLPSRSMSKAI
jgi:hypothetical protein